MIISVVILDQKILFSIVASVADSMSDNPNGIRTFLANDGSIFFTNSKSPLIDGVNKLEILIFD